VRVSKGASPRFSSVDDYIAEQPAPQRAALRRVRSAIRKAVPEATETIKYDMPTYEMGRKRLLHFAAWKEHYALYVATGPIAAKFKDELAGCSIEKGTIRFSFSDPVPAGLIGRIARFRSEQIR